MNLIKRPLYLKRLKKFIDRDEIKILVGIRGAGKTSLLNLFAEDLLSSGVAPTNILRLDFDAPSLRTIDTPGKLYDFISGQMSGEGKNFLLPDEVHRIPDWQKIMARLKEEFNVDIYISRSVALSEEKFFLPSIIVNVLPLSFKEFQNFIPFPDAVTLPEIFSLYLKIGGMPGVVAKFPDDFATAAETSDIFSSCLVQDVLPGNKITDFDLLMRLTKKFFEQSGTMQSFNRIAKLFEKNPPAVRTVENYFETLRRANIFYSVPVFDLKNELPLFRFAKYYPVDTGLQNFIIGNSPVTSEILESIVFAELLRLGVEISCLRVGKQIVFEVRRKDLGDKMYINVAENLDDTDKKNSPYQPLRSIRNQFAKWIVTSEENVSDSPDGIKVTNILDFLMSE